MQRRNLSRLSEIGGRAGDHVAGRRGVAMAAAELLGLSALVVAQPIFDALERSTYAFPAAGVGGSDLLIFAVALVLLPPAFMLAVELVAGLLSRSSRGRVHLGWVGLLFALLCWQAVIQAGNTGPLLPIFLPVAAGVGVAVLYLRYETARQLLRVLGFAAPVVAALFLLTPPINSFTLRNPDLPEPEIESKTPVVLVVFDEFPLAALLDQRGRIDSKRYPNFAALARESDWFRNALTVADSTEQAVPAILSGDLPKPNGVATYADHPQNIFTLLGSSYETNISESVTHLCPPGICAKRTSRGARLALLGRVGAEVADSFPFDLGTRVAGKLETWWFHEPLQPHQQIARFLTGLKAPPGGSLNAIHVELPHVPWQYMASGRRYRTDLSPLGTSDEQWSASSGYALQGLQRLILQLQYTDRVLGRMVDRLRRVGLYDRALLAVVADHGASFIPGQSRRAVGPATAGWILRVPLFVKLPGQRRGSTVKRPVRTIDLMPTIADVLDIRIPWQVDGRSVLGRPSTRAANTYMNYRDDIVEVPPATVAREFFSAIAVRNGFFGSGDPFTLGVSRRELRRQLHGAHRLDVALEDPGGTNYNPRSGRTPSLVYGRILDPPVGEPKRLIAKLNGSIVSVALSIDSGTGFTTLIPPSAFRPGANRLELYAR